MLFEPFAQVRDDAFLLAAFAFPVVVAVVAVDDDDDQFNLQIATQLLLTTMTTTAC